MDLSDFLPISVATLVPTEVDAGVELFHLDRTSQKYVLFRGTSHPLDDKDIESLRQAGHRHLYIRRSASELYQSYLRDLVGFDCPGRDAPIEAQISALNEIIRDILGTSFLTDDIDETIESAQKLGNLATDIICHDEFLAADLFRVLHHDHTTFTHSTNVALYAGVLAIDLKYAEADLKQIIVGGLLHDVGKLEIDNRILSKPGKLTRDEYREVQRHAILGFQRLAYREDLSEGQLMMAYQHHERLDGSGYPVGLVGNEIHDWGKLCAVVDVFEALTSHRPYRKPKPKQLVLEILQRDSAKAFDPEILACWVNITKAFWPS